MDPNQPVSKHRADVEGGQFRFAKKMDKPATIGGNPPSKFPPALARRRKVLPGKQVLGPDRPRDQGTNEAHSKKTGHNSLKGTMTPCPFSISVSATQIISAPEDLLWAGGSIG
eukprot:EG_transcript_45538